MALLRHYWKKGINATLATEQICEFEGTEVTNINMVQRWYQKFKEGDTSLEDKDRSGWPITVSLEVIVAAIEDNPAQSVRRLSDEIDIPK